MQYRPVFCTLTKSEISRLVVRNRPIHPWLAALP